MQSSHSASTRMLPAAVAGLVFSALMFLGLFGLISRHGGGIDKADTLPTIDFVRLKRETDLQTIERRKPPPPPPPKNPPPPPKLKVAADTPQDVQPMPFNMPNLGLSASVGGGPFLGQLGSGAGPATGMSMFEGDIIPLQRIAPQYPRKAATDGIEGYVKLQFIVNSDGTVREAKVVEAKPRGIFDAAAIAAALRWKFKPKVVDGKPVEQKGVQTIDFNLGEE